MDGLGRSRWAGAARVKIVKIVWGGPGGLERAARVKIVKIVWIVWTVWGGRGGLEQQGLR